MRTKKPVTFNLKELREELGISQREIAKILDIPRTSIGHWERNTPRVLEYLEYLLTELDKKRK